MLTKRLAVVTAVVAGGIAGVGSSSTAKAQCYDSNTTIIHSSEYAPVDVYVPQVVYHEPIVYRSYPVSHSRYYYKHKHHYRPHRYYYHKSHSYRPYRYHRHHSHHYRSHHRHGHHRRGFGFRFGYRY